MDKLIDAQQIKTTLETNRNASYSNENDVDENVIQDIEEIVDERAAQTMNFLRYGDYFKYGLQWRTVPLAILSMVLSQVLSQGCDYFISEWYVHAECVLSVHKSETVPGLTSPKRLSRTRCSTWPCTVA